MNGINYNALYTRKDVMEYTNYSKKAGSTKTEKQQKETYKDTVELDGRSRELPKAGYDRPKMKITQEYKSLDANGIQEGVELSDKAKKLLEELRDKYGDKMDISVARWSSDEEQAYYAQGSSKQYSALIAPEALEEMANDEEVRAKYEAVLSSVDEISEQMKEELGEDAEKIHGFQISIDPDGKVSYMAKLIQAFEESNKTEKVKGNSIDELIASIREKLKEKEKLQEEKNTENVS